MLVLNHPSQLKPLKIPDIFCTMGVFDGVHLGHKKILKSLINASKNHNGTSVVITFENHPFNILNPKSKTPLLTSPEHKISLLESLGVDICIMMKFNKAIAKTSAEVWIKDIIWGQVSAKSVYLGEDSFFGMEGKGNIYLMSRWGKQLGFNVAKADILRIEKVPVSSTLIRNFILEGDLASTAKFLGRNYSVFGRKVKGKGKGTKLGFPTINLNTKNLCLPPSGVYAVHVKEAKNCKIHTEAVANIGLRPTFGNRNKKPLLEIHILRKNELLDCKLLEVIFLGKIRGEQKFRSQQELSHQIGKDIINAKKAFFPLL